MYHAVLLFRLKNFFFHSLEMVWLYTQPTIGTLIVLHDYSLLLIIFFLFQIAFESIFEQ